MSNAMAGLGTKFQRETAVPDTYEDVAEVISISGPGMSRDTIDTTTLDTADGYRTFIAALRDAGTLELTASFVAADYELWKDEFELDTLQNYKILLTTGFNFIFAGLVTALPLNIAVDDRITSDVTIKISGKVTVADV